MRWQGRRGSGNIEDRRASSMPGGRLGLGGLLIVLFVGLIFGFDVTPFLQETGIGMEQSGGTAEITPADQRAAEFVSVTLADTEEVWSEIFVDPDRDGLRAARPCPLQGRHRVALRRGFGGDGAVLLPGRQEGLPRHRLLHHARAPDGGGRRLRRRLCRGARGRAPRAERAWHPRPGEPGPPSGRAGRVERDLGPDRAAGRLPVGRLGALCARRASTASSPATSKRR